MSKIGFFQDVFFTTVVLIFTTVVLSEKFSDRATTVVFYYSGFKIPKITLVRLLSESAKMRNSNDKTPKFSRGRLAAPPRVVNPLILLSDYRFG